MQTIYVQDSLLFFTRNRWIADIGMLIVCMGFFHWMSRKVYHYLIEKFGNGRHPWVISFVKSVHAPWLTFIWFMIVSFIIPIVMQRFNIDTTRTTAIFNSLRSFAFVATWYWMLMLFVTKLEEEIAPRWRRLPVGDKTTLRALAQLSRIALTIAVLLLMLPIMGFQTSSLLAFGGVSAVAVGYAAKDSLSNFLGGMMIFLDRPFSVGDWIKSPDRHIEGTVEHIGWRLTRIRTFSKRPMYVPNGIFSSIVIENPQRMSNRQINATLGVRYEDAAVISEIVNDIDAMLRHHPGIDITQTVMVHFIEFAASSLNINIYAFTKTTDWAKYRQVQQEVFLKAIAIVTGHGAECAFPTTTVLMPSYENDRPINPS